MSARRRSFWIILTVFALLIAFYQWSGERRSKRLHKEATRIHLNDLEQADQEVREEVIVHRRKCKKRPRHRGLYHSRSRTADFLQVDQQPIPINKNEVMRSMNIPHEVLSKTQSGTVVFRILVDEKGDYVAHKILYNPNSEVARAFEAQVHKLEFRPAIDKGEAVRCWINVPFTYRVFN